MNVDTQTQRPIFRPRDYTANDNAGVVGHLSKGTSELASALVRLEDLGERYADLRHDIEVNLKMMQTEIRRRLAMVALAADGQEEHRDDRE